MVGELLAGHDPPAGGQARRPAVATVSAWSRRGLRRRRLAGGHAADLRALGVRRGVRRPRARWSAQAARGERGAVDVVERRHDADGARWSWARATGGQDRLADAALGRDRTDRRRATSSTRRGHHGGDSAGPRGPARRAGPAARRSLEPDLDGRAPIAEQRGEAWTVPSPTSLPATKMPMRSQTDWTCVSRWLDSRIARPRSWTRARAARGSRPRRSGRSRSWARRGSGCRRLDQRVGDAETLLHAA